MSEQTAVAEKTTWAVTERGRKLRWTENEVDSILKLLVANGGSATKTVEQLRCEGINMERTALETWRDHAFPHRYLLLRTEMQREISEDLAGRMVETALEADNATRTYIEKAVAKVDQVDPDHLAKNALALANAAGNSVEKAHLLRNMPTEIVKVDLAESIEVLERLKVIEPDEEVVDAEVVEDA